MELLLHGFLTPQLVLKSTLRTNLLTIQSHLKRDFPNFDLIFDRDSHFYSMHDFLFGRHGRRLLVQIHIPIATIQEEFTVYKVNTFPVLVMGRTSHSTSILNLPSYFVTSAHSPFYFMIDHDDDTRHPELLYLLDNNVIFRSFATSATCVSALFRDTMAQIHNLCSFSLQETELEPAVHFLSNGKILLTNYPN